MPTTYIGRPALQWAEAPAPLLGLLVAALASSAMVAVDTLLAGSTRPGILLDWLPLVAAGSAAAVALLWAGSVRHVAVTVAITLLAVFPLLDPAPQPWMYAAPLAAAALALGLLLTPTTQALVALPALAGLLSMLELLPQDGLATLAGVAIFAGYLTILGLDRPLLAMPAVAAVAASADEAARAEGREPAPEQA
jgi:hypothetical protein